MDSESRYELLESLGSGEFATVYRARDTELNREVAIRQMHPQWLAEPRILDRYWAEAQLLASVQHPHIVTIYDIVRSKGWLVLELMQASLRDRLAGRPMDLRALRTTLIHALKALKYLHGRGIIHGDIHPGNLMVDQRKRVKVGDFGIARRLARVDGSVRRGTAKYMAPEALSGEIQQLGPSSDLYSLGFSCYELLCGEAFQDLFPGLDANGPQADSAWMMWQAAADRRLPPIASVLEGVPSDLAAVIEKLIQKNPQDRFQSADEVLAVLGDESKSLDRESSSEPAAREQPAPRPRAWVVALFAISCLASLAMLFIPSTAPAPAKPAEPKHGIVRSTDLTRGVLEYEDPLSGVPDEVPLSAKPRIRLLQVGEAERYVLSREVHPGDWLEIRPSDKPEDEPLLVVSRPLVQTGEITQLDAVARRLTISMESGRLRDEVPMHVPPRTGVTLNGELSQLEDARVGDRVEVAHLLDPTGKRGHLISQLDLLRTIESAGFLDSIESDGRTLLISDAVGKPGNRKVTLAEDASIQLSNGQAITAKELLPGDRLAIRADRSVRSVKVTRATGFDQGVFLESRDDGTCLIRSDSGNEVLLTMTPETDIRLGPTRVAVTDLRPQADRVQVTIRTTDTGEQIATSIGATRAIKHDRWALVIGNGTFQSASLPDLPGAVPDAEAFHQVLVQRYAVDPTWSSLLVDRNMTEVRAEFQKLLPQVTQPMQLIVAVFGHGTLGADGQAYLAFRGFRDAEASTTGIPLESLVDSLERCPANEKILLLDLTHGSPGDARKTLDLPKLLSTLKTPLKTLRILGASSEGERSSTNPVKRRGWFGAQLERAFGGSADTNRDLRISPAELFSQLEAAAFDSEAPATQHPFLWGDDAAVEPEPVPTPAP